VVAVVNGAAALHEDVYEADPVRFPQAYNVAVKLVKDGVVNVLIDGQPGFWFPDAAEGGSPRSN
jgi:hypothetical protein